MTLKDKRTVLLRPAVSSDGAEIRNLFHSMSDEDVTTRFFRTVRGLSAADVQRLCNVNFENEVAFVAVAGTRENPQIVAQSLLLHRPVDQPRRDRVHGQPALAGLRPRRRAAAADDRARQGARRARLRRGDHVDQRAHDQAGERRVVERAGRVRRRRR